MIDTIEWQVLIRSCFANMYRGDAVGKRRDCPRQMNCVVADAANPWRQPRGKKCDSHSAVGEVRLR
jgi:hypothetical protein